MELSDLCVKVVRQIKKKNVYLAATFFVVLAYSNGYTTLYQIMILPFVSVCVCALPLVWLSLIFNLALFLSETN